MYYKYLKKIIAIILCISVVFNIDHIGGLFGYTETVNGEEIELNTGGSVSDATKVSETSEENSVERETVTEESTTAEETESETVAVQTENTTIESSEADSVPVTIEPDSTQKQTNGNTSTEKTTTEKTTTEKTTTEKATTEMTTESTTKSIKKTEIESETTVSQEMETVPVGESNDNILGNQGTREEFYSNKLIKRYAPPNVVRSGTATASQAWDDNKYDELKTLTINSRADWQALVKITSHSSLEGAEVVIQRNSNWKNEGLSQSNIYNLNASDLTFSGYENGVYVSYAGIGTAQYPFRGTLSTYIAVQITMPRTLFTYMSSIARVDATSKGDYKITINYTSNVNVKAALAEYLIIESEGDFIGDKSRYVNLAFGTSTADTVVGTNSTDVAGGLFAHVNKADSVSAANFIINDNMLSLGKVRSVNGKIAGGIAGEVGTGVTVVMSGCPVLPDYVYSKGTCAGGVVGKLDAGSALKTADTVTDVDNPIVLESEINGYTVSGTGAVGGLIGIAENATVDVKCIKRYGSVAATQYAGGLIGLASYTDNTSVGYVKVSNFILAALQIAQTASTGSTSYCAGGVIGKYQGNLDDSGATVATRVEISNVMTAATRETTTTNQNFPKIMTYYGNNGSTRYFNGGIIGGIYGNNVKIHDISFKDGSYKVGQIWDYYGLNTNGTTNYQFEHLYKSVGTIAGSIVGKGIEIDSITIEQKCISDSAYSSNGMSGGVIGGLAGRVGSFNGSSHTGNKLKVSNICINSFFTWAQHDSSSSNAQKVTTGGLFGNVTAGSIISLGGDIDLSGVTKYYTTDSSYQYKDIMGNRYKDGSNTVYPNKGFVAGYADESLIYFEKDANVKRPVTVNNGVVYFNFGDSSNESASVCSDVASYSLYCVDDIGNYGSVYRNLANESGTGDVIDFSQPYGSEVTGTVGMNAAKDSYIIDSLQDALRLSIAGHTFDSTSTSLVPRFGANCFENAKITDILDKNLIIACNLNLKNAGIHGFVRNDRTDYGYSKSISGKDGTKYTITMDFISKQMYGGLFPVLNSGAEVKNLKFDGSVCYERGYSANNSDSDSYRNYKSGAAGAIAANSVGSVTLENVDVSTTIKGYTYSDIWNDSYMFSYGGYIGYVNLVDGNINVKNCAISPNISYIQSPQFAGGLFGRVAVSRNNTNINVESSNIGTQFSAKSSFAQGRTTTALHSRSAGLIGFIGRVYSGLSDTSGSNGMPANSSYLAGAYRHTNVSIKDCDINNAKLDLTDSGATYVYASGGLLGYAWCNVNTTIEGLKVENSVINSRGYVGGLVSFVNGAFNVKSVELDSLTMKGVSTNAKTYSGLLFGNAENAYVRVVESEYVINQAQVTYEGYDYFDEIVGKNLQTYYRNSPDSTINESYTAGGVLNIINSQFADFDSSAYASYRNRVVKENNRYTRYYYNLFEGAAADWTVSVSAANAATINSEKKLMTLEVALYANSNIKSDFADYFSGTSNYYNINKMDITADLNMNGYSYYPIVLTGGNSSIKTVDGNNHSIQLYGSEISELEADFYSESDSSKSKLNCNNEYISATGNTQQYLMHASLFSYNAFGVTISNIKLTGSVAYNGDWTGALIAGALYGDSTISDITVEDLYISDSVYQSVTDEGGATVQTPKSNAALLISKIGVERRWSSGSHSQSNYNTNITMSKIKTMYNSTTPAKEVASSLIYTVGSSTATDVKIHFTELAVSDRTDEKVFKNASLIYDYNYTTNSDNNRNYLLYTFDYAETVDDSNERDDSNVTYGKEIEHGLNYNNYFLTEIASKVGTTAENPIALVEEEIENNAKTYLPYVAENHSIFVNPRNGDITQGCGTYEDPYIINDAKQLLSLYCFISGKSIYDDMLANSSNHLVPGENAWKVNKIGGDGSGYECVVENGTKTNHNEDVERFYKVKDASGNEVLQENFPTMDDLRTAYYKISAHINLSTAEDLNDYMLVQEYSGLGTEKYPFAGVIVGANVSGEHGKTVFPIITLPKQGENNESQVNYGLLQFMQGAVVKDINITTAVSGDDSDFIKVTNSAGGVAAKIVGGDNIIDNVTTKVKIGAYTSESRSIGGYVGEIVKGSLIIRNAAGKQVVKDCEFGYVVRNATTENNVTYDVKWYKRKDGKAGSVSDNSTVGLLVGKVRDGFIIYENNNSATTDSVVRDAAKKVLSNSELNVSSNTNLEIANGFDIINGYALDEKIKDTYKIGVSKPSDGALEVKIRNGEGLEVIALALNSDALTVAYDEKYKPDASRIASHNYCGYDYTARCRKAMYSDVGATNSRTSADRNLAVAIDDGKKTDKSNIYLYPYLFYKYMDFTGDDYSTQYANYISIAIEKDSETDTKNYVSRFNRIGSTLSSYTTKHTCNYTTTYYLDTDNNCTESNIFDVSGYGESFRGLGALYNVGNSNFRANFDGNNMNVKMKMRRTFDTSSNFSAGMFNDLTHDVRNESVPADKSETALVVKNISIVDSIIENVTSTAGGTYTGALTGRAEGLWNFENIVVKRTDKSSSITDDSDKPKVAGREYVGGLIGSIRCTKYYQYYFNDDYHTSSNIINITGCRLEGYDDEHTFIVRSESSATAVGGLVGGIGTVRVDSGSSYNNYFGEITFEDCQVSNADIYAPALGNVGGFAGYIGNYYSPNRCVVGNVTVRNSTGKTYADFKNISKVKLSNSITSYNQTNASIGGLFGKVAIANGRTKTELGAINVEGFNVDRLIALPSKTRTDLSYNSGQNGIGGVIGYNRAFYSHLNGIHIENSYIGANDTASNLNNNLHTGGIVGYADAVAYNAVYNRDPDSYVSTTITIDKPIVKKTEILSNKGSVGGYIGYAVSEKSEITNGNVEGCTIVTNYTNAAGAGGVIGYIYHNYYNYAFNMKVSNQKVLNSTIKAINGGTNYVCAGGVLGYFPSSSYAKNVTLSDIYVGNENNILGTKSGGGLAGYIGDNIILTTTGHIGIGAEYDTDNTIWNEDKDSSAQVVYNNITGKYSGGLIGYDCSTQNNQNNAEIYVAHNRIYSYDRGYENINCASGGLVGYKYCGSASNTIDYSASVYVKNNIITTSGRGSYQISHNNFKNYIPVAGGIYGNLYGTNTSYSIKFPYLTLEDNSIGFYDVYILPAVSTQSSYLSGSIDMLMKADENSVWKDGVDRDTVDAAVKNFVMYYNSTLDAMTGSSIGVIQMSNDNMADTTADNSVKLNEVGITIDADTKKLVVDDSALHSADLSKLKALFGTSDSYAASVKAIISGCITNRYEAYKNLELDSEYVKLFKFTSSGLNSEVSWATESINAENVAGYSCAFGKFIGYYSGAKQVNILRPSVTYTYDTATKQASVGSIPAIDVGSISYGTSSGEYGTSSPYSYRNTCHIIYLDDETIPGNTDNIFGDTSLVVNSEKEYFFGNFESIVKRYNELNKEVDVTDTKTRTYNFIMSDRLNSYVKDRVKSESGVDYNLFSVISSEVKSSCNELTESIEALMKNDGESVFKAENERSNISNAVKEFVTNYNTALERMADSELGVLQTAYNNMVNRTNTNATNLSAVGITIDTTTKKLVVDDTTLNAADLSQLKSLFGVSGSYAAFIKSAVSDIVGEKNYYDITYSVQMFWDNFLNAGTTEYTDYNGVPVIVLDGQDVQALLDSVALILTNGAGAVQQKSANYMNSMKNTGMITIDAKNAYIAPDGKIYENSASRGIGTGANPTTSSIGVTNNYQLTTDGSSSQKRPYDEMITKDNGDVYYTITLLRYQYTVDSHTETLYIPVYEKEKVTMYQNVRVLSGENYYYPDAMSAASADALQVSHGSTYTIFTEFVYDSIREKNNFKNTVVNKTLVFQNEVEGLQDGTKLTLVDVATGIPYYYTVNLQKDENGDVIDSATNRVNKILFTEFKDSAGQQYKEKAIGNDKSIDATDYVENGLRLKDSSAKTLAGAMYTTAQQMGIERFFIYYEPPEGDYNTTFTFSIDVAPVQSNTSMSGFFDITLEKKILFDAIWGPQISFKGVSYDSERGTYTGEQGLTYIYGNTYEDVAEIRLNKEINIESYLDISVPTDLDRDYWMNTGGTIDSVNDGKSIDVALSLTDLEGEEVSWPEGTNIFINGQQTVPSGNVMYLYLDTNSKLAFNTLKSDIDGSRRWYYCDVPVLDTNGNTIRDANGALTYESRWITRYGDSEDETNVDLEGTYYYVVYEKVTEGAFTKNISKEYTIEKKDIAEIELSKGNTKVENDRTWYYYNVLVGKDEDDNDIYEDKWITLYGESDDETDTDLIGTYYYIGEENGQEVKYTIESADICDRVVENSLSNYMNVKINFASADIDDYADKKYIVKLKIYRSSNSEFPAEEEVESNIRDRYTEYLQNVDGRADKDIGVAVSADNPLDLGINLYNYTDEKSTIRFTNKFDFTNSINKKKLDSDGDVVDIKTCAANTYMVTYRLQKKVRIEDTGGNAGGNEPSSTYVYETISWKDSPFSLEQIEILDDGTDKTVEWDDDKKMYGLTNYDMETENADQTTTVENVYIEYKKFTYDEVQGTLQASGDYDYVTSWNLKLTADMAGLDNNDSLANYRITATYVPYDETAAAAFKDANDKPLYPYDDSNADLEDYFIFTVAKLKTDMD